MATQTRNAKSTDPYASLTLAVTRTRKGRKSQQPERFKVLDNLFAQKGRTLKVKSGDTERSATVTVIGPAHFDKPETWTGLRSLVLQWAKDRGHAIRTHTVSGNVLAVERKG